MAQSDWREGQVPDFNAVYPRDLVELVNGLLVFTFELKNNITKQTVDIFDAVCLLVPMPRAAPIIFDWTVSPGRGFAPLPGAATSPYPAPLPEFSPLSAHVAPTRYGMSETPGVLFRWFMWLPGLVPWADGHAEILLGWNLWLIKRFVE